MSYTLTGKSNINRECSSRTFTENAQILQKHNKWIHIMYFICPSIANNQEDTLNFFSTNIYIYIYIYTYIYNKIYGQLFTEGDKLSRRFSQEEK